MIKEKIFRITFYFLIIFSIGITSANAFEETITHPEIIKKAIPASKFETYLKQNFAELFPEGATSLVKGKAILDWLTKGSSAEDRPRCRASNHFHNPRLPWNQSYMTDAPAVANTWCRDIWPVWAEYSNITWTTGQVTRDGAINARARQDMGWDNARTYFYLASTATTSTERATNFAKTFQALGQVLHLLQDMAVPAHVRNDLNYS